MFQPLPRKMLGRRQHRRTQTTNFVHKRKKRNTIKSEFRRVNVQTAETWQFIQRQVPILVGFQKKAHRNSDAKHRNHANKDIGDEALENIQDRYSSNVGKILHMIVVNAELKKRTMMNG